MDETAFRVFEDPDVYCVVVPDPSYRTGATNCYVVEDEGDFLVVDAGTDSPEVARAMLSALASLRALTPRPRLFLTHLHADHAELAGRLFEGAPVLLGRPEARLSSLVRDEARLRSFLGRLLQEGFSESDVEDCVSLKLGVAPFREGRHATRFVEEGNVVMVGRRRFVVLDSSGHSPGHRSLFCPEAGLLIGGDQVLSSMAPYISLYPGVQDRLGLFLERIEAVSRLDVRCALCSHGPAVVEDFGERARRTAGHRRERARQMEELVRENPGRSGAELAKTVQSSRALESWDGTDRVLRLCVASNGLALLDRLAALGRVRTEADDEGVRRYFPAGRD